MNRSEADKDGKKSKTCPHCEQAVLERWEDRLTMIAKKRFTRYYIQCRKQHKPTSVSEVDVLRRLGMSPISLALM